MLTIRERKKIVKALPKNGYQLISDKLEGEYATETIRKYLTDPKYTYNSKVFATALEVIDEAKSLVIEQKEKIKKLSI